MSKKKLLILGGTRLIGPAFVKSFGADYAITLANRGVSPFSTTHPVARLTLDRFDTDSLQRALGDSQGDNQWDAVINSLCYCAKDAAQLYGVLAARFKQLVLLSTRSVYSGHGPFLEDAFDPTHYAFDREKTAAKFGATLLQGEVSYGEGKRQAEAYYSQTCPERLTILRFPIVIGDNDYTNRLAWHVARAQQQLPIDFGAPEAQTSFIDVAQAGRAIDFCLRQNAGGIFADRIFNVASPPLRMQDFIDLLGEVLAVPVAHTAGAAEISPYKTTANHVLDCSKIAAMGFTCPPFIPTLRAYIRAAVSSHPH